jgi:hypothetical protein
VQFISEETVQRKDEDYNPLMLLFGEPLMTETRKQLTDVLSELKKIEEQAGATPGLQQQLCQQTTILAGVVEQILTRLEKLEKIENKQNPFPPASPLAAPYVQTR